MAQDKFKTFILKHKTEKGKPYTNTSIGNPKISLYIDNDEYEEEEDDLDDDLKDTFNKLDKVFKSMESQKLTYNSKEELIQKIKDTIKIMYNNFINDIKDLVSIGDTELNNREDLTQQLDIFGSFIDDYFYELQYQGHMINLNDNEFNDLNRHVDQIYNKLWDTLNYMCDMCGGK